MSLFLLSLDVSNLPGESSKVPLLFLLVIGSSSMVYQVPLFSPFTYSAAQTQLNKRVRATHVARNITREYWTWACTSTREWCIAYTRVMHCLHASDALPTREWCLAHTRVKTRERQLVNTRACTRKYSQLNSRVLAIELSSKQTREYSTRNQTRGYSYSLVTILWACHNSINKLWNTCWMTTESMLLLWCEETRCHG